MKSEVVGKVARQAGWLGRREVTLSKKGWTNEELGLSWLSTIFEPVTKIKAGNSKCILIVDGHSSHLNMWFIDYCDEHNILLAILFPHSMHRLQPLDVSIFFPLVIAYSSQIDDFIQFSQRFFRVTKRSFWMLFWKTWKSVLIKPNIHSGFAIIGIWFFNPTKVFQQFQTRTLSPFLSDGEFRRRIPKFVKNVYCVVKALRAKDFELRASINLIICATEKFVIEKDILQHKIQQLQGTFVGEKKQRKWGKHIGLFIKNELEQAMFFFPNKIAAVWACQEELNTQKKQKRLVKKMEKQCKAIEKKQKAQKIRECKTAKQKAAAQKQETKQHEKRNWMLQKQTNWQLIYKQFILNILFQLLISQISVK